MLPGGACLVSPGTAVVGHHESHDEQAVEQRPLNEVAPAVKCSLVGMGGFTWQTACILIQWLRQSNHRLNCSNELEQQAEACHRQLAEQQRDQLKRSGYSTNISPWAEGVAQVALVQAEAG